MADDPFANAIQDTVHIIASPFKTGTSSIAEALSIMGVGRKPMRYRSDLLKKYKPQITKANRIASSRSKFELFHKKHGADMMRLLDGLIQDVRGFDVFHDAPIGHSHLHPFVLKTIMPQARFIWVQRPRKAWLQSVRNWELTHPETYPRHDVWNTDPDDMIERKLTRMNTTRKNFGRIKNAFPDDTLILNWTDLGHYDKLAAFCGVDIPSVPFPHRNQA